MIKVIGIGNPLMRDDGIALKVIDNIEQDIEKLNLGIKCIKAETDFNFALDSIDNGDLIFVVDSTLLDIDCGQITQITLEKVDKYFSHSFSSHNISLIWMLKKLNIKFQGIIIGIEVSNIEFGLGISKQLEEKLDKLSTEVFKIIKQESLEYVKKGESSA